ncbi:MAG: FecR domain-containing protein [Thermoanaerobaculales bacterium]
MAGRFEVDWVLIRVNTVKRAAAILATGVVAAALVFLAYNRLNLPPEARTRRAIEAAAAARDEAAAQPLPPQWQGELQQATKQLESARSAYADESWQEGETQALNARARFEALAGASDGELVGAGRFFSLEGRVQLQRAGQSEWETANQRMPVFNGDLVRTGRDGSAEILFADGSLYRIGPNSLLEIHNQQSKDSSGTVKMVVGRINVYTSGSPSTVTTNTTSTEIEEHSRVAVDVDGKNRATTIAAYKGSARVSNPRGIKVLIKEREEVAASALGEFSQKRSIASPPTPVEPQNNAGFDLSRHPVIRLAWRGRPASGTVHLQVGRSKRFIEDELDVNAPSLAKDDARLQAIAPGTYYWRIAARGESAVQSEWSPARRFRLFSSSGERLIEDRSPPGLEIGKPQQLGHMFIIEGSTEVGASVTINDEPVEVDSDGLFRKAVEITKEGWNDLVVVAVDPSGNRAERRERVFVEVY